MAILLYELVGADPKRPFSPHCWKAAMALAHKNVPFKTVPTSFTEVATLENGSGRTVPLIRDGDRLVGDSFEIALYLEKAYPDRPTLFGGAGGQAMARFVERWTQTVVHGFIGGALLADINACLAAPDQAYFRRSREARFGKTLEEAGAGRHEGLEGFRKQLEPLRATLAVQPFLGGQGPLFCDYIVFGAFQWARVVSSFRLLDADDPVAAWLERCLALHDGLAGRVPAAA